MHVINRNLGLTDPDQCTGRWCLLRAFWFRWWLPDTSFHGGDAGQVSGASFKVTNYSSSSSFSLFPLPPSFYFSFLCVLIIYFQCTVDIFSLLWLWFCSIISNLALWSLQLCSVPSGLLGLFWDFCVSIRILRLFFLVPWRILSVC